MSKIRLILISLLSLLFLVNICLAVDFSVSPGIKIAHPGDTVNYDMSVSFNTTEDDSSLLPFTEEFSIDQPLKYWTYHFSNDSVVLNDTSATNYSTLSITVPANATPGNYEHRVNATCYNSFGAPLGICDQFDIRVVNTDVSVPEFPSIALPVAAVLGLVAILGRKRE